MIARSAFGLALLETIGTVELTDFESAAGVSERHVRRTQHRPPQRRCARPQPRQPPLRPCVAPSLRRSPPNPSIPSPPP